MGLADAAADWRCFAQYTSLITSYLVLNTALNLMNRWALGLYGFSFPILLTMCHMAFSFLVLLPPMLLSAKVQHRATLQRQWKGLVCIGCFMALNIGLNNLSLVHIPLSLNQVIRASLPVVTAVVGILVESKVPSRTEGAALTLLTVGVIVAVYEGQGAASAQGIGLCVTGTLCSAAMMTTSSKVLSERIDALQMTLYTTPVSCCFLLPFFLLRELSRFMLYAADHSVAVLGIILVGSMTALLYNVVHYWLIQKTSAVTVTVLGEIKIVGLLVLSALLLPGEQSQFTLSMTLGCGLAMAGFCLYSNSQLLAARRSSAEAAARQPYSVQQEAAPLLADKEGAGEGGAPFIVASPLRVHARLHGRLSAPGLASPRTPAVHHALLASLDEDRV